MQKRKSYYDKKIKKTASEISGRDKSSLLRGGGLLDQGEVAKILGITRQAVHQAERRAFFKLRNNPDFRRFYLEYVGGNFSHLPPTKGGGL